MSSLGGDAQVERALGNLFLLRLSPCCPKVSYIAEPELFFNPRERDIDFSFPKAPRVTDPK
jgi:hypothetical protein